MSTHHHSPEIEYDMVSNKPTIINHYNQNKAGVDTLDQIMETNSVRRKTHRWTLNMFFFILDSALQNAASLTLVQKSKENLRIHDKFRFRKNKLEKLVVSLISPNALDRYIKFSQVNFKNIHTSILDEIKKLIPDVTLIYFLYKAFF